MYLVHIAFVCTVGGICNVIATEIAGVRMTFFRVLVAGFLLRFMLLRMRRRILVSFTLPEYETTAGCGGFYPGKHDKA